MARIRTIKPEFWTDSKTGTLSEVSKCLFLGLLNHADDYGVIEFDPMAFRAKIFPYHSDTTTGAVETALVDELLPRGLVVMFCGQNDDGESRKFLFIRNFDKHQVINKPSKPLLDGWKKGDTPMAYAKRRGDDYQELSGSSVEQSGNTPTLLPEGYSLERKGKERKGIDVERASAPTDTKSRKQQLPADYVLTESLREKAKAALRAAGKTVNLQAEFVRFCNHFWAPDSRNRLKSDWDRAFVNWCLSEYAKPAADPDDTGPQGDPIDTQWRARLKGYKPGGYWPDVWGTRPGEPGCVVPRALLREFGLVA